MPIYDELSATRDRIKKHAADITSSYSQNNALFHPAAKVTGLLKSTAETLDYFLHENIVRQESMTMSESFARTFAAGELNAKAKALLQSALLWKMITECKATVVTLERKRSLLNPNDPRRATLAKEIEEINGIIADMEHYRKDDGGDDGGDTGDSDDSSDDGEDDGTNGGGNYNPDEPRVPAGQPGGGQWTSGGGDAPSQDSGTVMDDAGTIYPADSPLPKPDGIPDDWMTRPSKDNTGIRYTDPSNTGNEVRVMQGDPENDFPVKQEAYVRWMNNGQWLDKAGNVTSDLGEAHIPLSEFEFMPEIFP